MTTRLYGGYTVEQLRSDLEDMASTRHSTLVSVDVPVETLRDLLDAIEGGEQDDSPDARFRRAFDLRIQNMTVDGDNNVTWLAVECRGKVSSLLLDAGQPVSDVPAQSGWQPIETAPKETEILGWRDDCGVLLIMHTSFDRWASDAECDAIDEETLFSKDWFSVAIPGYLERLEGTLIPTHWMPLPDDPVTNHAASAGDTRCP